MLYEAYQAHLDVLIPVRLMAEAIRGFLDHPWPLIGNTPLIRSAAATMELLSNGGVSHNRPDFGIRAIMTEGQEVAVSEEVVVSDPFCNLVHFRKDTEYEAPTILVVAPLSGHFPTLLRGTIQTLLPDHDVFVTDWANVRNVPLLYGRFGLDDFVDLVIRFIRFLGPRIHIMAVCQPSVPVLAAVSLCRSAFARLVRTNRYYHRAWALSRSLPPSLSRFSPARGLLEHEPRSSRIGALGHVS